MENPTFAILFDGDSQEGMEQREWYTVEEIDLLYQLEQAIMRNKERRKV